jgi:hypothetical protein
MINAGTGTIPAALDRGFEPQLPTVAISCERDCDAPSRSGAGDASVAWNKTGLNHERHEPHEMEMGARIVAIRSAWTARKVSESRQPFDSVSAAASWDNSRSAAHRSADIPVCGFTGLSSPGDCVTATLGTGDWKVARTRRLESLLYDAAARRLVVARRKARPNGNASTGSRGKTMNAATGTMLATLNLDIDTCSLPD